MHEAHLVVSGGASGFESALWYQLFLFFALRARQAAGSNSRASTCFIYTPENKKISCASLV
jgi:hypothetical protein